MKQIFKNLFVMLAVVAVSCSPEKIAEPLAYTFDDVFVNYKLPDVNPTTPEVSKITLAEVKASKANAEAQDALEKNLGLTEALNQSVISLSKKFDGKIFIDIETSFTNTQIAAMESGVKIDDQLQKSINLIINSGEIDKFKYELIMPTIDGAVPANFSIKKSSYTHIFGETEVKLAANDKDKCNKDAENAFVSNKKNVDADKVNAERAIVNRYDVAVDRAKIQYKADQMATKNKFKGLRDKATSNYNNNRSKINNDKKLSQANKNAAIAVQIALLNDELAKINQAEKAQEATDILKMDADIAKAGTARDTDLMSITTKYQSELTKLNELYRTAKNKCHNQGGGNNGNGNGNGGGNGTGNEGGGKGPGNGNGNGNGG